MLTRLFKAMLWLLPLGLCGCPTSPDTPCNSVPNPSRAIPKALLVVGEPVRMSLSPFESGGCAPVGVLPERVTAEITGPDGQPVPNEASINRPSSINGLLQFTPQKPGLHHFLAAFEPVGGIQQFELYAARNRSADAPLTSLTGGGCHSLERTDHGSVVCSNQVFRRDGWLLANLPAGRTAVAGNVVWLAGSTRIERYVDTGTGTKLELSATLEHTESTAAFILASPDELLVLYPLAIQRFTFDGTRLVSTGRTVWEGTNTPIDMSSQLLLGVLLRSGSQLALVSRTSAPGGGGVQVCGYQLEASGAVRTGEPCQFPPGSVVGYERSMLWMTTSDPGSSRADSLRREEWTGTRLETRGSLRVSQSLGVGTSHIYGPTSVPILKGNSFELRGLPVRAGVPVYVPGEEQLAIEVLDVGIEDPEVSSTLLWGTPSSGTGTRIRTRPLPP